MKRFPLKATMTGGSDSSRFYPQTHVIYYNCMYIWFSKIEFSKTEHLKSDYIKNQSCDRNTKEHS